MKAAAANPYHHSKLVGTVPSRTPDFWPANSLASWEQEPTKTFCSWLLSQHAADRQFRESSRETYAAMFAAWIQHLEDRQLSVLDAGPIDAANFFAAHALKPSSRRRYLQLLEKVYRHFHACGLERENPFCLEIAGESSLEVPLPAGLNQAQQDVLIHTLLEIEGWKGVRDRAMAALLLGAGLRSNELIWLPASCVDARYRVRVEPKSAHRAHTTFVLADGPWREWLKEWFIERTRLSIPGPLMCPATLKGKAYTPSGLFRRVSRWLNDANVETRRQGAGILRNTFARSALTCRRYTPTQVQEFLGYDTLRAIVRHTSSEKEGAPPPHRRKNCDRQVKS